MRMIVDLEEFKQRRAKVLSYLAEQKQKLLICSGSEKVYSYDVHYPFRADSDFYYLTGFTEPDSALLLDPSAQHPFTLYVRPNNPEREIWDGYRAGIEGAKKFGADKVLDIAQLGELTQYEAPSLYALDAPRADSNWLDNRRIVHSLRSIKSAAEIATIKKACSISVQAHEVLRQELVSGVYEYELEATLNHVFRSQGASGWAYPPIVATGANACVLHYTQNSAQVQPGDLVLVDAGCEYEYYASDITRVYAADGVMTREQQDIYDIVLASQKAAIETIKPGSSFKATHEAALAVIADGLRDLGYIKDISEVKKYYMHSTGHSLGLDVHDRGIGKERAAISYAESGDAQQSNSTETSKPKDTIYVPGMVTTVEPGIYVREKGIGIRIEDDVLVTGAGFEVLTEGLGK